MLYLLLFIAFVAGWVILKIAAGVIRIVLIVVLLLVLLGVGVATRDEVVVTSSPPVTAL